MGQIYPERIRGRLLRGLDLLLEVNDTKTDMLFWQETKQIERLIKKYVSFGRRAAWGRRRQGTRAELLREVLASIGKPAHFGVIHDAAIGMVTDKQEFPKTRTYSVLFYRTDLFRSFGNGVFGLSAWKLPTTDSTGEQILEFCPTPLLPQTAYANSFFDSIIMGRELLRAGGKTVEQLWFGLCAWAKSDHALVQDAQSAFDAWYAAGLLERLDYSNQRNELVKLTLPVDAKLNEVRQYCVNALCRRIQKMPELLLAIDRIAHPTLSSIQKTLFGSKEMAFDVANRLVLFGAFQVVSTDGNVWRLTDFGREVLVSNMPQELPDYGEIEAFEDEDQSTGAIEWDDILDLVDY